MKNLLLLRDSDIFPDTTDSEFDISWVIRTAVKVILLDREAKVAFVGTRYRLLPGGGVESGETLEYAVHREILEEVGCKVKNLKKIGVTEEYRKEIKRHQITHCYSADIDGEKGLPQTTQKDEQGITTQWVDKDKALSFLKEQTEDVSMLSYNSQFNVRTHIAFIENYLRLGN